MATITITEQTFEIGRDAYGRRVTATRHRTYDGKTMWRIKSDPISQRDDGEGINALSDDNLLQLAEAVAAVKN
jgi:hypothetical protein